MSDDKSAEQPAEDDALVEAAEVIAEGADAAQEVVKEEEQLKGDVLQLSADLENLKKSILTESAEARRRATQLAIQAFAPAIDALEMALRSMQDGNDEESLSTWRAGVEKVRDRFTQAMLELGAVPIPVDGTYDPKFHEAVEKVPGERYQIVDTLSGGWMWQDDNSVIVPAKVHVGSGKE